METEELSPTEEIADGKTVEAAIVTEDVIEVASIEEEDSELISEVGKDDEEKKVVGG